jgi:hypothetical protein
MQAPRPNAGPLGNVTQPVVNTQFLHNGTGCPTKEGISMIHVALSEWEDVVAPSLKLTVGVDPPDDGEVPPDGDGMGAAESCKRAAAEVKSFIEETRVALSEVDQDLETFDHMALDATKGFTEKMTHWEHRVLGLGTAKERVHATKFWLHMWEALAVKARQTLKMHNTKPHECMAEKLVTRDRLSEYARLFQNQAMAWAVALDVVLNRFDREEEQSIITEPRKPPRPGKNMTVDDHGRLITGLEVQMGRSETSERVGHGDGSVMPPGGMALSLPSDEDASAETTNARVLLRFVQNVLAATDSDGNKFGQYLVELVSDPNAEEQLWVRHNSEPITVALQALMCQIMLRRVKDLHPGMTALGGALDLATRYVNAAASTGETFLSAELDFLDDVCASSRMSKSSTDSSVLAHAQAMRLVMFCLFTWYECYFDEQPVIEAAWSQREGIEDLVSSVAELSKSACCE